MYRNVITQPRSLPDIASRWGDVGLTSDSRHQRAIAGVRFSNRPFGVKRFQTIHRCGVDVAHGLVLLFGIGTKALPSWDSKTRRNNLYGGLIRRARCGSSAAVPAAGLTLSRAC